MFKTGLYEQLITKMIRARLDALNTENYFISKTKLDKAEAAKVIALYLAEVIQKALSYFGNYDLIEKQIELSNKIIYLIRDELKDEDFSEDLISTEAKILSAIYPRLNAPFSNFEEFLAEITPFTRLGQSELFTGNNAGISLESELKKEILSADSIYFLVSFIKWSGIRIFQRELKEFTESGRHLKIITTSYMGATDARAIEFLAELKNTEVKISYNTQRERLHAKCYLFMRDSGFHTGYIGSSNISGAALTSGLEWNLKITTKEIPHIIKKSIGTFETYWQNKEFELYDCVKDFDKLREALISQQYKATDVLAYFDIKPFPFQQEILDILEAERVIHNRWKNLVVSATGTGKTVISAFDYKRFAERGTKKKLLYVAHRKEILMQAMATFKGILKDNNFGELWVDGIVPRKFEYVFASILSLNNGLYRHSLSKDYYDFIIIDEVHHIAAESYRPILAHFKPAILLGLTATPERMDGSDILKDFCDITAAEIRLPEALNQNLLCPFQYFGISDSIDLSSLSWKNGHYLPGELTKVYTQNDKRVGEIISNLHKYLRDIQDVTAVGFCVTIEHAKYMAEKFLLAGLKADYLVSENSQEREIKRSKLKSKELNYLFVRDIFNKGVDIPEIDTVLFLRPTESLTIFLQQLGRGLRLSEGKIYLTVLDFVGQAHADYDFESKFRALVGKTNKSVQKEIENDFPHLPLGCSIILEKKAKEYILSNIKNTIGFNQNQLVQKIRKFNNNSSLQLSLKNFINFYHIPLPLIYKKYCWSTLCVKSDVKVSFGIENEKEISRAIKLKWLSGNSFSYFNFILKLANQNFIVDITSITEEQQLMCLMLHYDVWQDPGGFPDLTSSIKAIGTNPVLVTEIKELLNLLLDRIDFIEKKISLGYKQALKVHSRYTKDQILTAFGMNSFNNKSSNREGVAFIDDKNTELLFITLNKSEQNFSPTTLYEDFAISDTLFNWQSQNSARPDKGKGLSYIEHQNTGEKILLFVREQSDDEYGNTMSFVFLGNAIYIDHHGSKPKTITWQLMEPMPAYIWKASAKLAFG